MLVFKVGVQSDSLKKRKLGSEGVSEDAEEIR